MLGLVGRICVEHAAPQQRCPQGSQRSEDAFRDQDKMPFVIRMMEQIGSKPAEGAKLTIQKAQHAMEKILELSGQRQGGAD